MGVKSQLAIVGVVTLLLPWAGCEYIKETESALRKNQQGLLRSSAGGIAAAIENINAIIEQPDSGGGQLYLQPLRKRPVLDGYTSEWTPAVAATRALQGSSRTRFSAAEFGGFIYLAIVAGERGDIRFGVSATDNDGNNRIYFFDADGPGPLIANTGSETAPRVRGFRAESNSGPRIELQIPVALARRGLGLFIVSGSGQRLATSFDSALPPAPIGRDASLQEIVDGYRTRGIRLHVVDSGGWIRAAGGALSDPAPNGAAGDASLFSGLYRRMLSSLGTTETLQAVVNGRDSNRYVLSALDGEETDVWLRTTGAGSADAIVAAAAPIRHLNSISGAVVLNQNSTTLLFLSNAALTRLTTVTLAVTLATVTILLAYATWLSYRIRRLSQAADGAMNSRGDIETSLPSEAANDEIGSLSRSFSTLLSRVGDYNAYLRALSGRLSHELRTPMAVVSSSLDNLEAQNLTDAQQEYATRARDGVSRLRRLVQAMSEATRVEQAAANATMMDFDLGSVIARAVEAYRDVYVDHQFRYTGPESPSRINGAPDLLVQLLDKLVDNAVSFAPADSEIAIEVAGKDRERQITVTNTGPLLPESMQGRLFDSLVSVRATEAASHMGFGLYIARLIAEAHGGTLGAANLADGSGVCFTVVLPG